MKIHVCDEREGDVCISMTDPLACAQKLEELSKDGMIVIDVESGEVYTEGSKISGEYIAQWPVIGG
jgi:hypothetical protein